MKSATIQARSMTDDELRAALRTLPTEVARKHSQLDAIRREARRRGRLRARGLVATDRPDAHHGETS